MCSGEESFAGRIHGKSPPEAHRGFERAFRFYYKLFVVQSVNRLQAGSLCGRVKPEQNPDGG